MVTLWQVLTVVQALWSPNSPLASTRVLQEWHTQVGTLKESLMKWLLHAKVPLKEANKGWWNITVVAARGAWPPLCLKGQTQDPGMEGMQTIALALSLPSGIMAFHSSEARDPQNELPGLKAGQMEKGGKWSWRGKGRLLSTVLHRDTSLNLSPWANPASSGQRQQTQQKSRVLVNVGQEGVAWRSKGQLTVQSWILTAHWRGVILTWSTCLQWKGTGGLFWSPVNQRHCVGSLCFGMQANTGVQAESTWGQRWASVGLWELKSGEGRCRGWTLCKRWKSMPLFK